MLLIDGDELAKRFVPKQAYFTESIIEKIKNSPIVRQTGEWIEDIDSVLPFDDGGKCRCSVCGGGGCESYWNYCPHCGSLNGKVEGE